MYGNIFHQVTRKERVARYLKKKERRTYEKTVRYASRKAYAESRPRVKGRFVKTLGIDKDEQVKQGTPETATVDGEGNGNGNDDDDDNDVSEDKTEEGFLFEDGNKDTNDKDNNNNDNINASSKEAG